MRRLIVTLVAAALLLVAVTEPAMAGVERVVYDDGTQELRRQTFGHDVADGGHRVGQAEWVSCYRMVMGGT